MDLLSPPQTRSASIPGSQRDVSLWRGKYGVQCKTGVLLNSGSFVVIVTSACDSGSDAPCISFMGTESEENPCEQKDLLSAVCTPGPSPAGWLDACWASASTASLLDRDGGSHILGLPLGMSQPWAATEGLRFAICHIEEYLFISDMRNSVPSLVGIVFSPSLPETFTPWYEAPHSHLY